MSTPRYSVSRQKACRQCASAKAKCDSQEPQLACQRCRQRGTDCSNGSARSEQSHALSHREGAALNEIGPTYLPSATVSTDVVGARGASEIRRQNDPPSFANITLICSINADDISNRWLNAYIPTSHQKPKSYPPSVTAFICRMLDAYVGMVAKGKNVPPFIHHVQVLPSAIMGPLATCLSTAGMCERLMPGNEHPFTDVLLREMSQLYEWRGTFDHASLLAAFQAYLIYAMMLYFRLRQSSNSVLQQAMMNLQELACASARQGLSCSEEGQQARPEWEFWIMAEAKRRTLYTMYLFDSVLLINDGLPTFLASEIHGLLAPGPKALWSASNRAAWEKMYTQHLADWPHGFLRIDELWPVPASFHAKDIIDRRSRVDSWLETVDEYGTMMYAVTSCTHGG